MFLRILFSLLCIALPPLLPAGVQAQGSILSALQQKENPVPSPVPLKDDITERKAQNLKALEEAEKKLPRFSPESAPDPAASERVDTLRTLNLYYEQILEQLAQKESLTQAKNQIAKELNAWKAKPALPEDQKTFAYLDQLQGQLFSETRKVDSSEGTLKTYQDSLDEAKEEWEAAERIRRRLKEEASKESDAAPSLELENAQLHSALTQARVTQRQLELENEKIVVQSAETNLQLLTQKIDFLSQQVKLDRTELNARSAQLEDEKKSLQRDLNIARAGLENMERQPPPEASSESLSEAALEEARYRGLEKQAYQIQVKNLTEQLQIIDKIESFWQRRYQLYNQSLDKSLLKDWRIEAEQNLESLQRKQQVAVLRFPQLRKDINETGEKLASENLDPEARRWLKASQNELSKISDGTQAYMSNLYRAQQFYQKLIQELEPRISRLTLKQRTGLLWSQVKKVWNFELTTIDDQPITVRKLFLVLILSIFGIRLARHLSRLLGARLFPRMGLDTGVAAGLQTLAFYVLVSLLILFILYMVNVPLTLFTVLGGAFAIGFGFGSQNILKNFISGLILLIERPIKIGDMVQLDDSSGVVERIGARSTLIRSFDNIHIIVPNSDLLEKKVVNMHLSDDLVRVNIPVGVRYGTDPEAISRLLLQAVEEHAKVLKNPPPIVLFADFAENSLKFEVHFWIRMRSLLERRSVESDVRFRLDKMFREVGIEFAYPQRDIHLETHHPLQVKLLRDQDGV